ncbi:MAG: hypothetical protein WB973_07955, partial [Thermoanaerobaculia bacterium]
ESIPVASGVWWHEGRREPQRDSGNEIVECQRCHIELESLANRRQIRAEIDISRLHRFRPWNVSASGLAPEPVANATNRLRWFVSMIGDVLAGDVGDVSLKPEPVAIEDQKAFPALVCAESTAAEIDAQFQRHVEPRERTHAIELRSRQVMNREAAAGDEVEDLMQAHIASSTANARRLGGNRTPES